MNPTLDNVLADYLDAVSRVTGASSVSLCLPLGEVQPWPLLLHQGPGEPLPELRDSGCAQEFLASSRGLPPAMPFWCHSSESERGCLVGMNLDLLQRKPVSTAERRRARGGGMDPRQALWLGLHYREALLPEAVAMLMRGPAPDFTRLPGSPAQWLATTLTTGALMAWEACQLALYHRDSITGLPGRSEFRACLEREFGLARKRRSCLALVLVNPDEFGLVNHRLGQETGDRALVEISARLHANLRRSDQVFRFGGAIFAVVMSDVCTSSVQAVAEKLRRVLTRTPYVEGGAQFSFSLGAAVYDPRREGGSRLADANEMLRRADQALNRVKLSGGARSLVWDSDGGSASAGNLDRLSGIFTADTEKDYRNMLLLWETITVISSWSDVKAIAREFVDRVGASLKPDRAALYIQNEKGRRELVAVSLLQADGVDRSGALEALRLEPGQLQLVKEAEESGRTQRLRSGGGQEQVAFAVPLLSRSSSLGVLYLDGRQGVLRLDTSDLVFLDALASQIGILLDRARLAERWKQEKVRESQRLKQEVKALKRAMQQSRMVYHSPQMQSVMETIGKVAPTDVTVLVMGESGTGKEMLARAVHRASGRSDKPFVTVDCGAIAHSLIDSELFGHVRGAYTGAGEASRGRILAANGGTLFLDEVGELPLDIQVKLLRLIQEREITPVGGTEPVKVDVRIVAATNRDLAKEVMAGRFRSDLYYRLQVVTVIAPPLRERPQDILPLARYFLQQYETDYSGKSLGFTEEAEELLLSHSWPGNVRELQNRILQAVITTDSDFIGVEDLQLAPQALPEAGGQEPASMPSRIADSLPEAVSPASPAAPAGPAVVRQLQALLRRQVQEALARDGLPTPLGRWLEDDLVALAAEAANRNLRQAARQVGMAETTFRRRLDKVEQERARGSLVRNDWWQEVLDCLARMIRSNDGEDLLEQIRVLLLEEVREQVHGNSRLGAALMGVTRPTYRRWSLSKLQEAV